jgi:hypothetical protein
MTKPVKIRRSRNTVTRCLLLIVLLQPIAVMAAEPPALAVQFWSLFGFTLNHSTMSEIKAQLGPTTRFPVPQGHHEQALCYVVNKGKSVVVFSSGELGGGEVLLGIALERPDLHSYPCAIPTRKITESLPLGLHLGMIRSDFT